MTAPELRAAVIGCGAFGRHHARIFGELAAEGVRLVGLVDVDPEGPRDLATRLGVPLVTDLAALPEPVDLVSVAVPTLDHRVVAEPLLRRGVHCLVEKPLAGSSLDARALMTAALEGNAVLQVGLVERFNPVLSALERLGGRPAFVEVHRLAPLSPRDRDTGVVMDLMIHDLDILNLIVGEEAVRAEAMGVALFGTHEDIANARVTFPSGCVANVTASRISHQRMRRFRIFSPDGYLSLDHDRKEAILIRPPSSPEGARPEDLRPEYLPIQDAEPLREEILALVRAVRQGERPRVGGADGIRALGLAERILGDLRSRPVPSRESEAGHNPL